MTTDRSYKKNPLISIDDNILQRTNRKGSLPIYWVAIQDFKYNTKRDRYYDADPMSPITMEYVEDTVVKKGDKLPKDFVKNKNYLESLKKFIKPIITTTKGDKILDGLIIEKENYTITKATNILKGVGIGGADVIGKLNKGDVVEVKDEGIFSTGKEILILDNGFIYKENAVPTNENKEALYTTPKQANLLSNKNILIFAVLIGGYFAYKQYKK